MKILHIIKYTIARVYYAVLCIGSSLKSALRNNGMNISQIIFGNGFTVSMSEHRCAMFCRSRSVSFHLISPPLGNEKCLKLELQLYYSCN